MYSVTVVLGALGIAGTIYTMSISDGTLAFVCSPSKTQSRTRGTRSVDVDTLILRKVSSRCLTEDLNELDFVHVHSTLL